MPATYRSDQIGSLMRPPHLLEARRRHHAGELPLDELRRIEDVAVLDALAKQERTGIEIFTDGELRRESFQTDVSDAVEGFAAEYPKRRLRLADGTEQELETHLKVVTGRLRQVRRLTAYESAFMLQHAPGPFKITMPSPNMFVHGSFEQGVTDKAYASPEELQRDLVAIIRGEMQALVDEGVQYLQLDEGFNRFVDPEFRERLAAQGQDPEKVLEADIAAENACYDALPQGSVTLGSHLCRGSRTTARGAGTYDWLAERLLANLHVDRFLLEYDSEQMGSFEPLRYLPKGKVVVLGLVTTKDPRPETEDELLRRIDQAAKFVPVEQLGLSTQCGFAGWSGLSYMSEDEQWRKLKLVADTARKVWC